MTSSTAKNLEAIVKAIDQHNANCLSAARLVLINQFEHERLGFDQVKGVPIKPDDSLGTGRLRIVCDGYHGPKKEEKQEEIKQTSAPVEFTVMQ